MDELDPPRLPQSSSRGIFSLGHSNVALSVFLDLLRRHDINVLVDVRSSPSSRYTPHFGGEQLRRAVDGTTTRYLFMGRELGGRPTDSSFYDDEGYVRYDALAQSQHFRDGLDRLVRGADRYRIALMCSEEDPISCHRRRLIGRALEDRGVKVGHIRDSGSIESEVEVSVREALEFPERYQMTLAGEPEWRSAHPVEASRRGRSTSAASTR